jgi:LEA14-like dessication related protein
MNISEILLRGGIRNVNLVCKDHYFPVSRVDFVGVVIGKLNNYQRYLITTLKIYDHNSKALT